jgi:UDP-N-acetyl-D-glucosamine dehydrogenase
MNHQDKAQPPGRISATAPPPRRRLQARGSDFRESPAFAIIHGLEKRGAHVSYMDPCVAELNEDGVVLKGIDPATDFSGFDAVVIVTDHSVIPRDRLMAEAKLVVDTRDALRNVVGDRSKVYGL